MHIKNIKFEVGDPRQFSLLKQKQGKEQKEDMVAPEIIFD